MHPEAPTYSALRLRAEFVQPPHSMFERDAGRRRLDDCFAEVASAAGESWTRPALDRSRDIGAEWRFLEGGVPSHALFQVDNVPMANLLRGDRHSAARKFCLDAMTSEQFAPAPLPFPLPCFSFSSIDAPRGAVGWRRCRWPCIFARGERVYHGKQNDHRRFPPGGNQGGGPTRKSRRGV
jgi:hypothetical protein